jgi:hypothetical protein
MDRESNPGVALSFMDDINMERPGLDDRHRDKDGRIAKKHGNTLVATIRLTYPHRVGHPMSA